MRAEEPNRKKEWAVSQVNRRKRKKKAAGATGFTLRTKKWRYTEWGEGKQGRELYDHKNDPLEQTNLAKNASYAKQVATLSAKLKKAVANTLPKSGKIPKIRPGVWQPNLTNP